MTVAVSIRRRVALYGNVTDAATGKPVAGVRVEITQGPADFSQRLALQARAAGERWPALEERPDRTRTAADGHFHFLDLPAGSYTVNASLPAAGSRYGTATAQATLTEDSQQTVSRASLDLKLPATTVKGKVMDAQGAPIRLAVVGLRGGPERAVTADAGTYEISGLEAGKRTFVVSARNFKDLTQTLDLGSGAVTASDFTLQPSPPQT